MLSSAAASGETKTLAADSAARVWLSSLLAPVLWSLWQMILTESLLPSAVGVKGKQRLQQNGDERNSLRSEGKRDAHSIANAESRGRHYCSIHQPATS